MKEMIYLYIIIGCYIAHRKTATLDVNNKDFLKNYLTIVFTYPKFLFNKFANKKEGEQ